MVPSGENRKQKADESERISCFTASKESWERFGQYSLILVSVLHHRWPHFQTLLQKMAWKTNLNASKCIEIVKESTKICKMCVWHSFCNSNPFVAPWVSEHIQWRHTLQLILLRCLCCRIKLLSVCQDNFWTKTVKRPVWVQHLSAGYILVPGRWDVGTLGFGTVHKCSHLSSSSSANPSPSLEA